MSTPPDTNSIEWLLSTFERMRALQDLMERAFPAHLFACLEANEIATIQWRQRYEDDSPLYIYAVDLDFDFSSQEGRAAREERLQQEVEALLAMIPVCVMVELLGHEHWVVFHDESFNSHYDDSGYWMDERSAQHREDYPLDPEARALPELLREFESLREQSAASLQAQLRGLLAAHQAEVSALRWEQYSPYFNDGEHCTFELQGEPCAEHDEDDFNELEPLAELLYAVHPEVLLRLFGNHAQVTLRGDDFSVAAHTAHD